MIGSKIMSDLAILPDGPEIKEGGDRFVPVANLTCEIGDLHLDQCEPDELGCRPEPHLELAGE